MQLMDVKTGARVQFHTLRNGKRVGLDKEIYTIKDINFNDWGVCEMLLECDGYEVFTNHEAVELATDAAIKEWEAEKIKLKQEEEQKQMLERIHKPRAFKQITIFDILEVV